MLKQLAGHLHQVNFHKKLLLQVLLTNNIHLLNVSGVFAAAALHLAILIHKKTIHSWYTVLHLRNIQVKYFCIINSFVFSKILNRFTAFSFSTD